MKRAILPLLFASTAALTSCNDEGLSKELQPASTKNFWYHAIANAECKTHGFNNHAHQALDEGHLVVLSAEDKNYELLAAEDHTLNAALVDGNDTLAKMTYVYRYGRYNDAYAQKTGEQSSITRMMTFTAVGHGLVENETLVREEKTIFAPDLKSKTQQNCYTY